MRPLTEGEIAGLFRKMRIYRVFFWTYTVSALLYLSAVVSLPPQPAVAPLPLADLALAYGALCAVAVALGRWMAFRPKTFSARAGDSLTSAASHIFLTLTFLLAAGESMGMAALTAASLGAGPPWKLVMLCVWQIALGVILSPDRAHWDRLLTRWEEGAKGARG